MKKSTILFAATLIMACGGGDKAAKDDSNNATASGVVAACDAAAKDARATIERAKSESPTMATEFATFYAEWRATNDAWAAEDHPCLAEGPAVMDRLATHKEVSNELEGADDAVQSRLAAAFVSKPDAEAFFDVLFAGGDKPSDEARRSAFNVAKMTQSKQYKSFSEFGWGQLGEDATTCATSSDPFDPKGEVNDQMLKLFENEVDVHVLCRLPVDAANFAGDDAGDLRIELTKSDDWKTEPITAVELGNPKKWGKTRFFTARFRVPLKSTRDAETYHINLVVRRPTMGDEKVVGTTFWWFR